MADALPPGSMDLETPEAPAPPPEPAAEPDAQPEPDANQPAAVDAVEVAGKHYVPVAAVQDERAKRQAAETRAPQLQAQAQQNEPILALLRNNPGLLQRPEPPPAPAPNPTDDPDALEAARLMDFYTADGKPDAERGARYLALQDRRSGRVAQQAMGPLVQQSQLERANLNFQKALAIKDPAGHPINPQNLRAVWTQVQNEPNGVNILADPQAAAFVAAAAMGLQTLTTQPTVAPVLPPPLVTEPSGGTVGRRQTVTELETRVAAERGRNVEQWAGLTKGHVAGRPNLVEE